MTIVISAGRVGRLLNGVVLLLVLAHIAGQFSEHELGHPALKGLVPRFNMNGEMSVPTWFASLLLLACAGMLAVGAQDARRFPGRFGTWWGGLAVIFVYLALDEAVAIHELTIAPLRRAFGVSEGWLYFAWVLPAAVVVLALGLASLPFLRQFPAPTRRGFVVAGTLYVGGALGVESIGGWYLSTQGDNLTYELIGACEEVLELEGAIVFLVTLIAHCGRSFPELGVAFRAR